MKKLKTLLLIVVSLVFLALAYYVVFSLPKQRALEQARNQARSVCQNMLDKARSDYSKMKSLNDERVARGFPSMVSQEEWNQYEYVFTSDWFLRCMLKNLENYGYTAN